MRAIFFVVLFIALSFQDALASAPCRNGFFTRSIGQTVTVVPIGHCPKPGNIIYFPVPIYIYPPMNVQIEWISFNNVNAEGRASNGNIQYIQFQLGVCKDGKIWCRTMAIQNFFDTREQAISWVGYINQLSDLKITNENPAGRVSVQRWIDR